jgi:hypothetical protein
MLGHISSLVRDELAAAYTSQAHEVANCHERKHSAETRGEEQLREQQLTHEKELQGSYAQKGSEYKDDPLCRSGPMLIHCFLSHT